MFVKEFSAQQINFSAQQINLEGESIHQDGLTLIHIFPFSALPQPTAQHSSTAFGLGENIILILYHSVSYLDKVLTQKMLEPYRLTITRARTL